MSNDFRIFLNDGYKGIGEVRNSFPSELKIIEAFNKSYENIGWGQKLFNYVNNVTSLPKCKCGNDVKFYKFGRGYAKYCSIKCMAGDDELKEERKNIFLEKYGVENPLQSPEIREKRKILFFEKHGVEHQSQLDEVKEKKRKTNLDRYGVTTNLLHEATIIKTKLTNLEKYGVEHNSQSELIKDKKRKTNLTKCGFDYNFQSEEFKLKSEISTLTKYGVKHTSLSPEIRKKQLISKEKNKILKIAKIINIDPSDITIFNDVMTIKNYCHKHNEFDISQNLFHQRWYKYDEKICTKCYPIKKQVSGCEIELKNFIDSLGVVQYNNNKKILKNGFEIDSYIPEKNFAIEFDGLYWHSDVYKTEKYHLNKTEECEQQNIHLIHVFENEWLFKKEIVMSIIKSKLNLIDNKIFGRKCIIKEVDSKISKEFLNQNHLQGNVNSNIKIGLFYCDELVSIMTFGKKRVAMGNKINVEGEYEMLRFCNKLNTHIIGGASKLLKYFKKTYQPKSILTFADRRYSQGKLYEKLGFEFIENTKPNYWYFKKNDLMLYHRFKFRKDVLMKEGFDSNMTEKEIMLKRDFYRIYDCGNMKFNLNL